MQDFGEAERWDSRLIGETGRWNSLKEEKAYKQGTDFRVSKLKYEVVPIEARMALLQNLTWTRTKITTELNSNDDRSR